MLNIIALTSSSIITVFVFNYIDNLKKESISNKSLFINEFKKSEVSQHNYMSENYLKIKDCIKKKYKILDYLDQEDELYTKCLFKEDRHSFRYNVALIGKHDIKKVRDDIEFDVLRECFINIYKYEEKYHNGDFIKNNKYLILYFTKSLAYNKKIIFAYKLLFLSLSILSTSIICLFL